MAPFSSKGYPMFKKVSFHYCMGTNFHRSCGYIKNQGQHVNAVLDVGIKNTIRLLIIKMVSASEKT